LIASHFLPDLIFYQIDTMVKAARRRSRIVCFQKGQFFTVGRGGNAKRPRETKDGRTKREEQRRKNKDGRTKTGEQRGKNKDGRTKREEQRRENKDGRTKTGDGPENGID
jgi:hypothetical protein